jgi:hypothetical protein
MRSSALDGLCRRSRSSNQAESGTAAKEPDYVITSTPYEKRKMISPNSPVTVNRKARGELL